MGVTPSNFVKLFDADKTRMIGYPKGERKKEKDMLTAKSHNINSKYQKWDWLWCTVPIDVNVQHN